MEKKVIYVECLKCNSLMKRRSADEVVFCSKQCEDSLRLEIKVIKLENLLKEADVMLKAYGEIEDENEYLKEIIGNCPRCQWKL